MRSRSGMRYCVRSTCQRVHLRKPPDTFLDITIARSHGSWPRNFGKCYLKQGARIALPPAKGGEDHALSSVRLRTDSLYWFTDVGSADIGKHNLRSSFSLNANRAGLK